MIQKDQRGTKSGFLGMSFSTADYRLKKLILFSLLQKLNEDFCYRCGLQIETSEDLTVEHKEPWLYVDPDLFWDLNNIAFSHGACNSGASRKSTPAMVASRLALRKIGEPGTAWCVTHQSFLSEENFDKKASHWNGLNLQCKDCRKKSPSRRSKKNKEIAGHLEGSSHL